MDSLESVERAAEVLRDVERLERSSIKELQREYTQRGLAMETGMEKGDIVSRLRDVLVWERLPVGRLQAECRQRGVAAGGERGDVVRALACAAFGTTACTSRYGNIFSQAPPPAADPGAPRPPSRQDPDPGLRRSGGGAFRANLESQGVGQGPRPAPKPRVHPGMPGGQRRREGPPMPGMPRGPRLGGGGGPPPPRRAPEPPAVDAHFRTLGLPRTADQNEVRKAYRKLALQYHPDKNPGKLQEAAATRFKVVSEAYEKVCAYLRERGPKPGPS